MPTPIVLKGNPIRKEATAAAIITPGELLEWDGSGELQPHSTAGGNAQPMFAVEQDFIGNDETDNYAAADQVQYVTARQGDIIYARLADSQTITKGMALESDGNGELQEHTPQAVDEGATNTYTIYTDAIVGYAMEDVTTSGAIANIRIEVA